MRSSFRIAVLFTAVLWFAGCADDRPTEKPYRLAHSYSVSDPQFSRTMGSLLGPPLVGGNSITTLLNGNEIFPAMLKAIRSAQRTIDFETYVYWGSEIGNEFTDALCERAEHGVKVHVILDPLGSDKIDHRYLTQMHKAGVHLVEYHASRETYRRENRPPGIARPMGHIAQGRRRNLRIRAHHVSLQGDDC